MIVGEVIAVAVVAAALAIVIAAIYRRATGKKPLAACSCGQGCAGCAASQSCGSDAAVGAACDIPAGKQ